MQIKPMLSSGNAVWVIAMLLMFILLNYTNSALQYDMKVTSGIARTENLLLQLRRNEKDFLARKNIKYADKFSVNFNSLKKQLDILKNNFSKFGYGYEKHNDINNTLAKYNNLFVQVVTLQNKIGLNKNEGLYGDMRQHIHNIEVILGAGEHKIHNKILEIRRNEKDFMLRFDESYAGKLQVNIIRLETYIESIDLSLTKKQKITSLLNAYQSNFLALVNTQKQLGYSAESGVIKIMRDKAHHVENILLTSLKKSQVSVNDNIAYIKILANSLSALFFIIACFINWYINKSILKRYTLNEAVHSK